MLSRLHPSRLLTIHNLAWEAGVVGWFAAQALFSSPLMAAFCLGTGVLGSFLLRSAAPTPIFQAVGGSYHVGIRHIPGDRARGVPPMAAYYPTHIPPNVQDPETWLPHDGDVRYVEGLASYSRLPTLLFRHWCFVGMRCTRNAAPIPLWNPTTQTLRPLVVFSHGLAAHCRLYSLLAMDMAARGAIVIVPEHQDGSSCFSRDVHHTTHDACTPHKHCPAPCGSAQERQFREDQLNQRRREIEAVLRSISSGRLHNALCHSEQDIIDLKERSPGGIPQVALVGHSFGGATVLATAIALATTRDETLRGRVRVHSVACFDTWHLPLQYTTLAHIRELCGYNYPSGLHAEIPRGTRLPPLLLLESEAWEKWAPSANFQRELIAAYQGAAASVAEIIEPGTSPVQHDDVPSVAREVTFGTDHMSCCDVSVLSPVLSRKRHMKLKPRQQITIWARRVLQHISQSAGGGGGGDARTAPQQPPVPQQGNSKASL